MNASPHHPTETPADIPPRRRWRLLRFLALFAATIGVLIALAYGIENFRGHREWATERDRLLARGVVVDYDKLIPPPIPDDVNFAQIPLLRPLFEYSTSPTNGTKWQDTNAWNRAMRIFNYHDGWAAKGPSPGLEWTKGRATDLEAWQAAFREVERAVAAHEKRPMSLARAPAYRLPATPGDPAADVLAALEVFREDFDAMSAGLRQRPQCRFAIHYEDDFAALLPHLALLKKSVGVFALRASARLAAGQTNAAFDDVQNTVLLADTPRTEIFVISQLVRIACLNFALQPVWEGMTRHQWTEAQLTALAARLSQIDPLAGMRQAFALERAAVARVTDRMGASLSERRRYASIFDDFAQQGISQNNAWNEVYVLAAPRGWFYSSLAQISRRLDELATVPTTNLVPFRQTWNPLADATNSLRHVLTRSFFSMKITDERLSGHLVKAVRAQAYLRLAVVACALERHYLATGAYPDSLAPLVPKYLAAIPEDPLTGKPLNYSRESATEFRLWATADDDNEWAWIGAR